MSAEAPTFAPLRLGIVGLGRVHQWHATALEAMTSVVAVAATDLNPDKQTPLPCPRYATLDELLGLPLDAVLVAVSTRAHFDVARRVLQRRIPLLLEKPAVLDMQELDGLYAMADAQGVPLVVAFHDEFAPEVKAFAELFQARLATTYGRPTSFACTFRDPYAAHGDGSDVAGSLVGSWVDSGVNALSVVCSLFPRLTVDGSVMRRAAPPHEFDVLARVQLRSAAVRGSIETDWTQDTKEKSTRICYGDPSEPTAVVELDHRDRTARLVAGGAAQLLYRSGSALPRLAEQYCGVFEDFTQHVRRGTNNEAFAREVHELLLGASDKMRNAAH